MRAKLLAAVCAVSVVIGVADVRAQDCPCDCYFSGDCNPGMFCDYGNLGNEDTCFWRQPKPQGTVGAGCEQDFNDWGQCDGFCTSTASTSVFTFEDSTAMADGVALWGEALTKAARDGGGLPDSRLVSRVYDLPFGNPTIPNALGRIAIEVTMLARGEKSMIFPSQEDFRSDDFVAVSMAGDPCRISAGNVAIEALVAEIREHGSGWSVMADFPTGCLDHRMLQRVCMDPDDPVGCIYQRIRDFGDVIARSGRVASEDMGGIAGGAGCEECVVDGDCDDFNACTLDQCTNGFCIHDDYEPPCDGAGCNDCNGNGLLDECELAGDCNANNIPDECESNPQCSTDFCDGAAAICPGTANGTTADATNDGSANCGNSASSPDVWYAYTPATNGTLNVTTCGSGYDTVLSLHSGCPGTTGNVLACNDDSCGLQSSVSTGVTAGETYLIRVSGYNGSAGMFTLNVTGPDCADVEPDPLEPPVVVAEGPRYLSITPAADGRQIALQVSSTVYACVDMYVNADGGLSATPLYRTPAQWGTVILSDELVVPGSMYQVTAVTQGLALASPSAGDATWEFGDVNNDVAKNFEDIQLVVQGFQQNWENVSLQNADLAPCTPNAIVNFEDVTHAVAGFQGQSYDDTPCTFPCE